MSNLRQAITDLAGQLRATLEIYEAQGVIHEPSDAALCEPDEADAAWLDALGDEEPDLEDDAPEEPVTAGKWDQVAKATRASSKPSHHDDGTGAEGLAQIRADLGDCTRCRLSAGRHQIVFGTGDADADLLIVTGAPDTAEDAQGAPFVGPAGVMLDKMLEHVLGLARAKVYLSHIVKCRPSDDRAPKGAEAATCKPFLHRQIAAVQPRLILVMGGVALEQLLDVRNIGRQRGQEFRFGAIPVIATLHPNDLIARPDDKRLVFDDLKLARRRYDALGGRR